MGAREVAGQDEKLEEETSGEEEDRQPVAAHLRRNLHRHRRKRRRSAGGKGEGIRVCLPLGEGDLLWLIKLFYQW